MRIPQARRLLSMSSSILNSTQTTTTTKIHSTDSSLINGDLIHFHTSHCLKCVDLNACEQHDTHRNPCPVVWCPNQCHFRLHRCKLDEHLNETCPNETINCINRTNGCKFRLKRADLTYHLMRCPANVVRCSSFSTRLIKKKLSNQSAQNSLKWLDPIKEQKFQLVKQFKTHDNEQKQTKQRRLNQVLLDLDHENLKEFARQYPLKFQRMYGYVCGLKLENLTNSAQQNKFMFMRYLLKNVKSRIFQVS